MKFEFGRVAIVFLCVQLFFACTEFGPDGNAGLVDRFRGEKTCVDDSDCGQYRSCVDYAGYCENSFGDLTVVGNCFCPDETDCHCQECDIDNDAWVDAGIKLCGMTSVECEDDEDCSYEPGLVCYSNWLHDINTCGVDTTGVITCRTSEDCQWGWECVYRDPNGASLGCNTSGDGMCCASKACNPHGWGVAAFVSCG